MALVLAALLLATTATNDIVARFFPPELKVRKGVPIRANELQQTALTADLDHSGQQLIVALYTNDDRGAIDVLSPQGGGSLLATDDDGLPGGNPALRLVDVDGDGRMDIVASVTQHRGGTPAWIFRWKGTALERLHRTGSENLLDDAIIDPTFVDLNGDGTTEIIEHTSSRETDDAGDEHWVAAYEVLAWSNGTIASAGDADALATFTRGKRAPRPTKYEFSVDDASGARRLVVVNGTPAGASRVSSAVITLNGAPVLAERDFNPTIARQEVPVTLTKGENELGVELRGAPGSQLTIVVLPK